VGKYFLQLLGEGHNAKTTLMQILCTAFPTWVKMLPIEHLLMRGRHSDANAPQPWKMDAMGARLLCFEEPPDDARFDGNLLKLLRGGGVVTGRNLYAQNVSYLPTYRIVIAANSPMEIDPTDRAVLKSIHVYKMPSTFVDAGDARLGPPPQPLVFPKVEDLPTRFGQRAYRVSLLGVLAEYYAEFQRDGLDTHPTQYDLRSIYEEAHGRTDQQWFDEFFEAVAQDDGTTRLTTGGIHAVLAKSGYTKSKKALGTWLNSRFQGHASVRTVNHHGTKKWVCIQRKPAD